MRFCLSLLLFALPAPAASADDVLQGWSRFGSTYARIDMDSGSARACSALCDQDGQCQAWVFAAAGLEGPDARCELQSSVATPRRHPGRTTGLSRKLTGPIEAAAVRAPTAREIEALRATRPPLGTDGN